MSECCVSHTDFEIFNFKFHRYSPQPRYPPPLNDFLRSVQQAKDELSKIRSAYTRMNKVRDMDKVHYWQVENPEHETIATKGRRNDPEGHLNFEYEDEGLEGEGEKRFRRQLRSVTVLPRGMSGYQEVPGRKGMKATRLKKNGNSQGDHDEIELKKIPTTKNAKLGSSDVGGESGKISTKRNVLSDLEVTTSSPDVGRLETSKVDVDAHRNRKLLEADNQSDKRSSAKQQSEYVEDYEYEETEDDNQHNRPGQSDPSSIAENKNTEETASTKTDYGNGFTPVHHLNLKIDDVMITTTRSSTARGRDVTTANPVIRFVNNNKVLRVVHDKLFKSDNESPASATAASLKEGNGELKVSKREAVSGKQNRQESRKKAEKKVVADQKQKHQGSKSEDCGQMHQAAAGHLASTIIDTIIKRTNQNTGLKRRFSSTLTKKYRTAEMKNLDFFRNAETEADINQTEVMLHEMMQVLNKIILNQVHRRTCRRLPPNAGKFLQDITGVPTKSGEPFPDPEPFVMPDLQDLFLFNTKWEGRELEHDEIEIQEQMAMINGLLQKYERVGAKCKQEVRPVREYLVRHLAMLQSMMKHMKATGCGVKGGCHKSNKTHFGYRWPKRSSADVDLYEYPSNGVHQGHSEEPDNPDFDLIHYLPKAKRNLEDNHLDQAKGDEWKVSDEYSKLEEAADNLEIA